MVQIVKFTGIVSGTRIKNGVLSRLSIDSSDLIVHGDNAFEDIDGFDLSGFDKALILKYQFEQCQIVPWIRAFKLGLNKGLLNDEILYGIPHNMGSQERIKAFAVAVGYPVANGQLYRSTVEEWLLTDEGKATQERIKASPTKTGKKAKSKVLA